MASEALRAQLNISQPWEHHMARAVSELSRALEQARALNDVLLKLSLAADLFLGQDMDEGFPVLVSHEDNIVGDDIEVLHNVDSEVRKTVFWRRHFLGFADCLLSVVASDWLLCLNPTQADSLFYIFFREAPAALVLTVLVDHLNLVETLHPGPYASPGISVTGLSDDVIMDLLARRFAAEPGQGVWELCEELRGTESQAKGYHSSHLDPQRLATLLVSLPNRLPRHAPVSLHAENFIPHVLRQVLEWCMADTVSPAVADQPPPNCGFPDVMVIKMCMRGYADMVGVTIVEFILLRAAGGLLADKNIRRLREVLLEALSTPGAVEKLVRALLIAVATMKSLAGRRPRPYSPSLTPASLLEICLGPARSMAPGPLHQLLCDQLLIKYTLPVPALLTLLDYLGGGGASTAEQGPQQDPVLMDVTQQLAGVWGDNRTVLHRAVPQQAFLTTALALLLQKLGSGPLQASTCSLTPTILKGISVRLSSPRLAIRWQAMRVGRLIAKLLDPQASLFDDQGPLGLLAEEKWPGGPASGTCPWGPTGGGAMEDTAGSGEELVGDKDTSADHSSPPSMDHTVDRESNLDPSLDDPDAPVSRFEAVVDLSRAREREGAEQEEGQEGADSAEADSADADSAEADSDDESEDLEPYDFQEDGEEEELWKMGTKPLQLPALAAAIRKSDNVTGVLEALKKCEILVRAEPDELSGCAPELCRALLHCRVPEWAEVEEEDVCSRPQYQRLASLVALLATVPVQSGDTLIGEVYSPHLDMSQRLLILDTASAAAHELADQPGAPQLTIGRSGVPRLHYAQPLQGTKDSQGSIITNSGIQGGAHISPDGRTRVWGPVSLAKSKEGRKVSTYRNRFLEVALRWTAAMLRPPPKSDSPLSKAFDIFDPQHYLFLGRLLVTLGSFLECTSQTSVTLPLARVLLEIVMSHQVSESPEPFVRRSALLSIAQTLHSLPPAALIGAVGLHGLIPSSESSDPHLLESLQWIQKWTQHAAALDPDEHCKMIATACCSLHSTLMTASLKYALETSAKSSREPQEISIVVPKIEQPRLP